MTNLKYKKVDIELEQKDGSIAEDSFMVRKLRFDRITNALTEVHEIYDIVMNDQNLKGVFEELFGQEDELDPEVMATFTEEEKAQIVADRQAASEQKFLQGLMGSFNILLLHLPKKAGDLLATMANMDRDILGQQELETILDIYEAVLKVNDLEALLERGKKSLAVTRQTVAFLNLRRESTDQIKH